MEVVPKMSRSFTNLIVFLVMLKNYTLTALRYFLKDKTYFISNLLGLCCGITSLLLINIYLQSELQFDDIHVKKDRIYRVTRDQNNAFFGPSFGWQLRQTNFPEVEEVIRLTRANGTDLSYKKSRFSDFELFFADQQVVNVFSFEWLKGHADFRPNTIILTAEAATRFFGDEDPIGQSMTYQNREPVEVVAVIKDLSHRSHLPFDALINHNVQDKLWGQSTMRDSNTLFWTTSVLYMLMKEHVAIQNFPSKLSKHLAESGPEKLKGVIMGLQPLGDIYLHSSSISGFQRVGDIKYVYIFSGLALLILVIATFNFINLSTAQSVNRAREVGIRKSMGAHRAHIARQFLVESFLMVLLAVITSFFLVEALLPTYSAFLGRPLSFELLDIWPLLLGLVIATSLLAGGYPSLVLAAYHPIRALKGQIKPGKGGIRLRKVLVTGQFLMGTVVTIAAILIYQQMQFITNKDLGFEKEQLMIVDFPEISPIKFQLVKNEILRHHDISQVGGSWVQAFHSLPKKSPTLVEHQGRMEIVDDPHFLWADHDFVKAYQLSIIAGKNFTEADPLHETEFLVNESAAQFMGFDESHLAIGSRLQYGDRSGEIVGVVKDFHFESLHTLIKPTVLFQEPERINVMSIKFNSEDPIGSLKHVRQTLSSHFPDELFPIHFLDENYRNLYGNIERLKALFGIFAALGIFLECLGLFALSSHIVARKRKEIGIRKVLGASLWHIMSGLSAQFGILIAIGFIVACPLTYLFISQWLQDFAYHVPITAGPFLIAGLVAFLSAFLTINLKTLKSARENPVNVIRTE